MKTVKLIIFDWGWTLHNPETDTLFDGVDELISRLSKKYLLAVVSLARSESPELRLRKIKESSIHGYLKSVLVGGDDKDKLYEDLLTELKILPSETAVVDDRVVRGIAWGNRRGAKTIWLRNGKFKNELPNQATGEPNHTIASVQEIDALFL